MENNQFIVRNKRQRRALTALLDRDSISIPDLGKFIGSLNPRQTIMELRRQGFSKIIKMERFTVQDRDGKTCRPGKYSIPEEYKKSIRDFLNLPASAENTRVIYKKSDADDIGGA